MKKLVLKLIPILFCISFYAFPQKLKVKPGDKFIDIKLPGVDGKEYKLSDLTGYYILLEFWASWCPPCRKKNPQIVALYNKYKNKNFKNAKGFTIFSVSLDKSKKKWIEAIKDDNLSWEYHVSDLKYWNNKAALDYGVQSIPTTFLIDPNGTILGIDLTIEQISSLLDKAIE